MKHLAIALILAVLTLNSSIVYAGRPLNTDDTGVVPPGELEIELSYDYVDVTNTEFVTAFVLTTGITDGLDIGVLVPYQFIDVKNASDEDGYSDVSVTTKWNFLEKNDELFDATLSISYKSDSGDATKGLGTGGHEWTILGIISKSYDSLTYHVNLGSTIVDDARDVFNYNFAAEWNLIDSVNLVAEVFGTNDFKEDFDDNSTSALVGFTWEMHERIIYDAGLTFGISDADPDFAVTTGLTIAL